jgi:hypothetical protein
MILDIALSEGRVSAVGDPQPAFSLRLLGSKIASTNFEVCICSPLWLLCPLVWCRSLVAEQQCLLLCLCLLLTARKGHASVRSPMA